MPNKGHTRKGRKACGTAAAKDEIIRQLEGKVHALERERKERRELEVWISRVSSAPLDFVYEDCVGVKSECYLSEMVAADRDWIRKKALAQALMTERTWRAVSNEKLPGHLDIFLKLSRYLLEFIMGRLKQKALQSVLWEWKVKTGHLKDPLESQKISADRMRFLWAIQYGDVTGNPTFEELGISLTRINQEYGAMKHEERLNSLKNPEYLIRNEYNFEEGRKRLEENFKLALENFGQIIVDLHTNSPRFRA